MVVHTSAEGGAHVDTETDPCASTGHNGPMTRDDLELMWGRQKVREDRLPRQHALPGMCPYFASIDSLTFRVGTESRKEYILQNAAFVISFVGAFVIMITHLKRKRKRK